MLTADSVVSRSLALSLSLISHLSCVMAKSYPENYLQFGFIPDEADNTRPFCLLCNEPFAHTFMRPSKMRQHYEKVYNTLDSEEVRMQYFRILRNARGNLEQPTVEDYKRLSFEVAAAIVHAEAPHSFGSKLLRPALEAFVPGILHQNPNGYFSKLPLSKMSIARRIGLMAEDVESQLVKILRVTRFSIQLDETQTRTNRIVLICFARYVSPNSLTVEEDFLFIDDLGVRGTSAAIYDTVTQFLADRGIPLQNVIACSTDGAASMVGCKSGFLARLKQSNPALFTVHCVLHREQLVAKNLHGELYDAMTTVVRAVKAVRDRPTGQRLFEELCRDSDEQFTALLKFTEIRWLSRGQCLARFVELYDRVAEFFAPQEDLSCLQNQNTRLCIHYLADVLKNSTA